MDLCFSHWLRMHGNITDGGHNYRVVTPVFALTFLTPSKNISRFIIYHFYRYIAFYMYAYLHCLNGIYIKKSFRMRIIRSYQCCKYYQFAEITILF